MTAISSRLIQHLLVPPAAAMRDACRVQLPISTNGTALGSWGVCCAMKFPPPPEPCVAISIGIGGEWTLEDALAAAGCFVHAFDPTDSLREQHANHALLMPHAHRLRFYYLGLSPGEGLTSEQPTLPYGPIALARTASLESILDLATAGRVGRNVDILKIGELSSR